MATSDRQEGHVCSWPGCSKVVRNGMWGCSGHWYTLPAKIRNRLWAACRMGITHRTYSQAANEALEWIEKHLKSKDLQNEVRT